MVYDFFLITLTFVSEIVFFVAGAFKALYRLAAKTRRTEDEINLLTMKLDRLTAEHDWLQELIEEMRTVTCFEYSYYYLRDPKLGRN